MKLHSSWMRTTRAHNQHRRESREGQALVEFAFVGLILALMMFGVVEFGRAYFASVAVTNAARDAARVAMDPSKSNAEIEAVAQESAGSVETTVDIDRSTTVGETSTITVIHDFTSPVPLIDQFWGGGALEISHTATSRVGWE